MTNRSIISVCALVAALLALGGPWLSSGVGEKAALAATAAASQQAGSTTRDVIGSGRPAFTGAEGLTVQHAAPIPKDATDDRRRQRNYPEQPPVIPHAVTGYQLDLNANKCLTCHSRQYTGDSQAPMVSVTHFQDRDGQVLGAVSARRYFCLQCHVPQADVQPRVPNMFQEVDKVIGSGAMPAAGGKR